MLALLSAASLTGSEVTLRLSPAEVQSFHFCLSYLAADGLSFDFFSRFASRPDVRLRSRVSASRNTLFLLLERVVAMFLAVSTLRSSKNAGDFFIDSPNNLAA